jgi:hypothetical protein
MANAVAVPTPDSSLPTGQAGDGFYRSIGSLAISVSPAVYVTGGIALNFLQSGIKAQRKPLNVSVTGQSGYTYEYIPGTDASNGLLKILVQDGVSGNPLAELAASAIPAGVSSDKINYEAKWRGML